MDQCRQRCWIAAAVLAVVVLVAMSVIGDTSLVAGLLLGLLAGGMLAGLLIWGVCEGRGSAAENDALMAVYWEPEPFTPSRRVVAAGGRVVSQRPLDQEAPADLGSTAPLQSVTLQPSRDPAVARLVEPPAPEPGEAAEDSAPLPPPSETVALLATPSIASVIPVEPLSLPGVTRATGVSPRAAGAGSGAAARVPAGSAPASDFDPSHGIAVGEDRVATITDLIDEEAAGDDGAGHGYVTVPLTDPTDEVEDELTLIDGVGPMQARWLRDSGVTTLAQIAAWDEADIARFSGMMGREGHRIRGEDWVAQAAALGRGEGG